MRKLITVFLLLMLGITAFAQDDMDDMMEPSVTVADQIVTDGTVTIESVVSDGLGWMVIHADNGEGAPGPVIGFSPLSPGMNFNVRVELDTVNATPTLFAMLHTDTGEEGVYEFGSVEGVDGPVSNDEGVITPPFSAPMVQMDDQFVEDGTVTAATVTSAQDGWLVIHADADGSPGPVLGQSLVAAGTTLDVAVTLEGDVTDQLWPMLHVDTGEAGVYEFGSVEGADGPVNIGGVLTFPISTVPAMRVPNQVAFGSDAMGDMGEPTLVADTVLSEVQGWLVVHADADGSPGPVIGVAPVSPGINFDVMVELDSEGLTPTLWPMLHVDTGEEGVYEFGEVEGADGPVIVGGNVLTFPINGAPSITYSGTLDGTTITVDQAVIDAPGWMVIHADADGSPGPVIGFTPILEGVNNSISVELNEEGLTETLFPMLHYDTGATGEYEFGAVEGADGPVVVLGNVVTGPLTPGTME